MPATVHSNKTAFCSSSYCGDVCIIAFRSLNRRKVYAGGFDNSNDRDLLRMIQTHEAGSVYVKKRRLLLWDGCSRSPLSGIVGIGLPSILDYRILGTSPNTQRNIAEVCGVSMHLYRCNWRSRVIVINRMGITPLLIYALVKQVCLSHQLSTLR